MYVVYTRLVKKKKKVPNLIRYKSYNYLQIILF